MGKNTIKRWIDGANTPQRAQLIRLSQVLETSVDELLEPAADEVELPHGRRIPSPRDSGESPFSSEDVRSHDWDEVMSALAVLARALRGFSRDHAADLEALISALDASQRRVP